jgi:Zn-dependent protease with chaperone function
MSAAAIDLLDGGRRRLDRYAGLELVTVVAAFLTGLAVPFGPLLVLIGWRAPLLSAAIVAVWALGAAATLVPSWSAPLTSWLLGLRDCTPAEYQRLAPLLADVGRRLGLDTYWAFSIRIWPCPRECAHPPYFLNACAAGLNLIAVSEDCLTRLSDDELRALLAHEVGHHIGYQPAVRSVACYYLFVLDWTLGRLGPAGRLLRWLLAWPVLLAIAVAAKPSELHCDEIAARLGYGRPLGRLLRRLGTNDPRSMRGAIMGSHPALADRLHRIDHVLHQG